MLYIIIAFCFVTKYYIKMVFFQKSTKEKFIGNTHVSNMVGDYVNLCHESRLASTVE